jgi:Transcription factor Tfb2
MQKVLYLLIGVYIDCPKFCLLPIRFPGFVVATITDESFYKALNKGITADQIISFLQDPKHSDSSKTPPVVPPNVTDWMKLCEWEWKQQHLQL